MVQILLLGDYCTREFQMRKIRLIIIGSALVLAACGQSSTGGTIAPTSAPSAVPPTSQPTTAPLPTVVPPTSQPTAPPAAEASPVGPEPGGGTSVRPPDALVRAAQQQLAAHLKVNMNAIALQSANAQDWPDGALGCPKEGMAYPQVVTPGFLLVFTDAAQTHSYAVHTGMDEAQMVLCADNQPIELGATATGEALGMVNDATALDADGRRALELAQAALARELGIQPSEVSFVQGGPMEWSDSSLGCPKPDQAYLQVITPGYQFTLQAHGQSYEYHTDLGKRAVRCGP
jgi:hypothetical protein